MSEFEGGSSIGGGAGVAMASGSGTSSGFGSGEGHAASPTIENHAASVPQSSHEMFKDISHNSGSKPMIDMNHGKSENSMFKHHEIPHKDFQTESSSTPIVDINHGKENTSMFKTLDEGQKPMIDISRPVAPDHAVSQEKPFFSNHYFGTVRPLESPSMPQAQHEKESSIHEKSGIENKVASSQHEPNMKNEVQNHVSHSDEINERSNSEQETSREESQSHQNGEVKISPFENTYTLWQRSDAQVSTEEVTRDASSKSEEVLHSPTNEVPFFDPRPDNVPEVVHTQEVKTASPEVQTQPDVQTQPEEKTQPEVKSQPEVKAQPKPQTEVKPITEVKTQSIEQLITYKPEVKKATITIIERDLELAQTEVLPQIMEETDVSLAKAREALAQTIKAEHASEVTTTVTDTQENVKPALKPNSLEARAAAIFEERKKEKDEVKQKEPEEEKVEEPKFMYLKKDKTANEYRQQLINLALEKSMSKNGTTGEEVAHIVSQNIENGTSEIVKGLQKDGSIQELVRKLRNAGTIRSMVDGQRLGKLLVDLVPAVKLSFQKKEVGDATEQDAERVYQKDLDRVDANASEDNSTGKLVKTLHRETLYVVQKQPNIYPVDQEKVAQTA